MPVWAAATPVGRPTQCGVVRPTLRCHADPLKTLTDQLVAYVEAARLTTAAAERRLVRAAFELHALTRAAPPTARVPALLEHLAHAPRARSPHVQALLGRAGGIALMAHRALLVVEQRVDRVDVIRAAAPVASCPPSVTAGAVKAWRRRLAGSLGARTIGGEVAGTEAARRAIRPDTSDDVQTQTPTPAGWL
jgi:hypothetical protein